MKLLLKKIEFSTYEARRIANNSEGQVYTRETEEPGVARMAKL